MEISFDTHSNQSQILLLLNKFGLLIDEYYQSSDEEKKEMLLKEIKQTGKKLHPESE